MLFGDFTVERPPPKPGADVLSRVPKCKEAVTHFKLKTCVLDKLPSGMSSSATGHKFHVKESTIYMK